MQGYHVSGDSQNLRRVSAMNDQCDLGIEQIRCNCADAHARALGYLLAVQLRRLDELKFLTWRETEHGRSRNDPYLAA